MPSDWEPKILAFLCNSCSYAGADLAGVSHIQYPPTSASSGSPARAESTRFSCLRGLQNGADGVLVSGCHPGDCHYISGNLAARRKFALVKELLKYAGIEPERVQFTWVSASEGGRFAAIVEKVVKQI